MSKKEILTKYPINPNIKLPRMCCMLGLYWRPLGAKPKCNECPLGYNRMNNCLEFLRLKEAQGKLINNEIITEEMARLLDIHRDYVGSTNSEVESYLGINEGEGDE